MASNWELTGWLDVWVGGCLAGAIIAAKLSIVPVRRGYWGRKVGKPHTVPIKVTGKCGSVRVRLVPAPRGCGLVAAPVPKKLLNMAGVKDVYTSTTGNSRTLGNFVKAVFQALSKTYGYLTPDLWPLSTPAKAPYQEHTDFLTGTYVYISAETIDRSCFI
jgi:small subunit ribosomal protein S2e